MRAAISMDVLRLPSIDFLLQERRSSTSLLVKLSASNRRH
jgi:hypothetical protein